MALGSDTIWSKAILSMKDEMPDRVFLHAEIPYISQPDQLWFKQVDKNNWNMAFQRSSSHTIYDKNFESHDNNTRKRLAGRILQERNIGMIDHCEELIAVYDNTITAHSGTFNAIQYAKRKIALL